MTTLPSFVELMASLGLDQTSKTPEQSSPYSSPTSSPSIVGSSPTKSRAIPSLRDTSTSRNRVARYSPYSPNSSSARRGSLSSVSPSSPESDWSPPRAHSASPRSPSSPHMRRRVDNKLTVNVYGSTTDLAANTPISTYVRRKTPGTSPTSPTFSRDAGYHSSAGSPMPFTLPTLPPLFPQSASSDVFPLTPDSDSELLSSEHNSPSYQSKRLPDILEVGTFTRRSRHHTGVRLSTPPSSADLREHHPRRRTIIHIA